MGGPGIGILLREPLSSEEQGVALEWTASRREMSHRPLHCTYQPTDGSLSYSDNLIPLYVNQFFDFWPQSEVQLGSHSNQPEDHRNLGELTLELAVRWNGIIDFYGALMAPLDDEFRELWLRGHARWSDLAPLTGPLQAKIRGTIITVPYEVYPGIYWVRQIADTTFMRSWLKHPGYYLLK